jgi:hypothetical protein
MRVNPPPRRCLQHFPVHSASVAARHVLKSKLYANTDELNLLPAILATLRFHGDLICDEVNKHDSNTNEVTDTVTVVLHLVCVPLVFLHTRHYFLGESNMDLSASTNPLLL